MNACTDFATAVTVATAELTKSAAIHSVTVRFISISGLVMEMTYSRDGIIGMQPVE